jgi:glycosyltransferase involved in cell wall biosynthesis
MTIHVVGPTTTRLVPRVWSACPVTAHTVSLVAALRRAEFHVVEYSNHGSETVADEHVVILDAARYAHHMPVEGQYPAPHIVNPLCREFMEVLAPELRKRVRAGDVVMYAFLPLKGAPVPIDVEVTTIEPGVGYEVPPWGAIRVYESEAWRHYMWGKFGSTLEDQQRSAAIPWAFDVDKWPLDKGGDYVSFLGRAVPGKGLHAIYELARANPTIRFKLATQAFIPPGYPSNVDLTGPIYGEDRARFLGGAFVHLCPTEYVEPFCASAVEAMLCGTPVVSTDWGGFTETVINGVTGQRCASTAEMLAALGSIREIDRSRCRSATVERFSVTAVAGKWRQFLLRLSQQDATEGYTHG